MGMQNKSSHRILLAKPMRGPQQAMLEFAGYNQFPKSRSRVNASPGSFWVASMSSEYAMECRELRRSRIKRSYELVSTTPTHFLNHLSDFVFFEHGSHTVTPSHFLESLTDLPNVYCTGEVEWVRLK